MLDVNEGLDKKNNTFTSSCHHAQVQKFLSGGGGGGVQARWPENSLDNVFFYFSSQLILQFTEGIQWFFYRENFTFPRIQRVSNIFQGRGSNFFHGENAYNL